MKTPHFHWILGVKECKVAMRNKYLNLRTLPRTKKNALWRVLPFSAPHTKYNLMESLVIFCAAHRKIASWVVGSLFLRTKKSLLISLRFCATHKIILAWRRDWPFSVPRTKYSLSESLMIFCVVHKMYLDGETSHFQMPHIKYSLTENPVMCTKYSLMASHIFCAVHKIQAVERLLTFFVPYHP